MPAYEAVLSGSFGPLVRMGLGAVSLVAAVILVWTVVVHLFKVVASGGKSAAVWGAAVAIGIAAVAYQALNDLPATLAVVNGFGQMVWTAVGQAVRDAQA